jgi:indolepyruvate ferredoxin oxidoreductase, beta subunit
MKYDIVISGVGGQGVLSLSAIIALSALENGYYAKQSEIHGMAQRGGAVHANLRISDKRIPSPLVPRAAASMILSLEPLESLRYLEYLSRDGILITSTDPVANIPDYPPLDDLLKKIATLPNTLLIDGARLAKKAGAPRSSNMVLAGAAAHVLPFDPSIMENSIRNMFKRKGERMVEVNLKAFRSGQQAVVDQAAPTN